MKKAYIQPSTKAETIKIDECILAAVSGTNNDGSLDHTPGTGKEDEDPAAREFDSVWDEEE